MIIVLDEAYRDEADKRFAGHELRYFPPTYADRGKFSEMLADAHVLGMRRVLPFPIDRRVVGGAAALQFIHKSGSGADHFDTDLLSELGILLGLNTGFNAVTVAEHTVSMILILLRRITDFAAIIDSGRWALSLPGDEPLMLSGKTIGLVGIGAIGARVARAMIAMDAKVIAYHPDPKKPLPEGVEWVDLDTLVAASDVVSLHTPLTPATTRLIGARQIGLMKPTAILVNTARGGVVDEPALIAALQEGRIRAAGLDVFEEEPLPPNHPLRSLPNVFATPHIAGVAKEVTSRQIEGTLDNIAIFVSGACPERLVNPVILKDGRARARHLIRAFA